MSMREEEVHLCLLICIKIGWCDRIFFGSMNNGNVLIRFSNNTVFFVFAHAPVCRLLYRLSNEFNKNVAE